MYIYYILHVTDLCQLAFVFYMCGLMIVYIINCILWMFRVTTIYPVQDQNALQDRRVMSLIQYAKKVEKSMFEVARSRVSLFSFHYRYMYTRTPKFVV